MSISRKRAGLAAVSAMSAAILLSGAGYAADLRGPDSLKDAPDEMAAMHGGNVHSTLPAGVSGAAMVGQGEGMAMYMPMVMGMDGNYIGTGKVWAKTILSTPNLVPPNSGMMAKLLMVPESMTGQMHMIGASYGLTDAINVMVMGSYVEKDMSMSTYAPPMMGVQSLVGTRTYSTDGIGDASVTGLFRLYDGGINHVHLNFGVSLPTGDITKQMTMLTPMGGSMTMRAAYGMQPGTGTVDLLPGLTYTGNKHFWTWGAAYRGRFALDDNNEGYHWGDSHMLTGWLGYTVYPGITATVRAAGTVQDKIQGRDTQIYGVMQGANPAWYGGEVVNMFGGVEVAGHEFGLGHTRFAVEAGAPVYQNLNGPQMGQDWQVNAVAAVHF